ncbi:MAG: hypothetical protein AAFW89_14540 [Bacteroidota bacterium]
MRRLNLWALSGFYVFAGAYHFMNPAFYYPLIPDYLPFPEVINTVSGVVEILLGIGVLFKPTRTPSAYSIVAMLVAFIPAHIHFLQIGSCADVGLCVPEWISWIRLLVIHPLLIAWALSIRNRRKPQA